MSDITVNNFKAFYEQIRPYLGAVHSGFTPIGTVISVMGTTAPLNYLACDGTVYNISDYPELAAYFNQQFGSSNFFGGNGTTTFAVPDLRGEFLRGTGTNSHANQGSGANVGVHQDATIHPNVIGDIGWFLQINSRKSDGTIIAAENTDFQHNRVSEVDVKSDGHSTASGVENADYTSRPTNTSVLFCIASKNIFMDAGSNYSTEEQVVGTWIDGKPLYQKTVDCGAMPNNTTIDVNHNISNMSKTYDIKAVAVGISGNSTYTIPNSTTNNEPIDVNVNTTRIRISCKGDWSAFKGIVTIQYTKTTD